MLFTPGGDMTDEEMLFEDDEDEPVEGYCVRCRETVVIEDPEPVWTRKGLPAMRGTCPTCGNQVFRLGKTAAHERLNRPSAVKVATNTRAELPQQTMYVNFAPQDAALAAQIAADLQRVGVACWLHEHEPSEVNWAGGVHPALKECTRMLVVLSPSALGEPGVEAAWRFFREKQKPIIIAQAAPADPPDPIRRSPRYNFAGDYKAAFRQMVQALQ